MENRQQLDIAISNYEKEIERNKKEREICIAKRTEMLGRDRALELPALIAKIKELGLNASDLDLLPPKKKKMPAPATAGAKKFRDPVTGQEWSGRGGQPLWIRGKNKELFLNPKWSGTSEAANVTTSASDSNSVEPVINPNDGCVTNSPIEETTNNVIELVATPGSNLSPIVDAIDIPAITSVAIPSPAFDSVTESSTEQVAQAA